MLITDFGTRLKQVRIEQGLTQSEMAELTVDLDMSDFGSEG